MELSESIGYPPVLIAAALALAGCLGFLSIFIIWRNQSTRQRLEKYGYPTVTWMPRFVNYDMMEESTKTKAKKLSSSSITGILPRMQRLGGPYEMYGTVYGISTAVIHVAHVKPARKILSSPETGSFKDPAYNHFENFCGQGVFTEKDQDKWKSKRLSVLHCLLKGPNLEQYVNAAAASLSSDLHQIMLLQRESNSDGGTDIVPIFQRATIGLIYRFITHDNEMDTSLFSANGVPQDVSSSMNNVSTSNAGEVLHRINTGSRDESNHALPRSAQEQQVLSIRALLARYLNSVNAIRMIILAQSRSIWFLLPRWCYRLFSSMYSQEEETMRSIRQFAAYACLRAKPSSPLASLSQRSIYSCKLTDNGVIGKQLLDEAITLLFAGQDTTAATLSWTLHLLALHPQIQKELAQEVTTHATMIDNLYLSKEEVMKMPLLHAVLKESMRLYPVAPFVVRRINRDIVLSAGESGELGNGTILPRNSLACIWIYGLHRNPKFWKNANHFMPQRWLNSTEKVHNDFSAFMPFATGSRNCLGQALASVILRILLARLIRQFEFLDPRMSDVASEEYKGRAPKELYQDMQAGFTVVPVGGVKLLVRERTLATAMVCTKHNI